MQNFMKTILSAVRLWTRGQIKQGVKDSTADWNQNDPNADSYVKNRTHWDDREFIGEYLSLSTFNFSLNTMWPFNKDTGANVYQDLEYSYDEHPWVNIQNFGKVYKVYWDGVVYDCKYHDYRESGYLGNKSIHDSSYIDTGEPFVIIVNPYYDKQGIYIGTLSTITNHTICICENISGEIHTIDEKFIPDLSYKFATVDNCIKAQTTADAAQTTADAAQTTADAAQTTADAAQTTADAAQTTAATAQSVAKTAQTTADSKMSATDPVGTGSFSMNKTSTTPIGINACAIGTQTVAMHLSESAFGQYNAYDPTIDGITWEQAEEETYLSTKPTQATAYVTSLDDVVYDAGVGYFSLKNATTVCARDVPTGVYILFPGHDSLSSAKPRLITTNRSWGSVQRLFYYEYKPIVTVGEKAGVYLHTVGNGTSNRARSNAHTLDWNGVGWYQGGLQVGGNAQNDGAKNVLLEGEAIPIPATASESQTIVVKAVDENGTPTEWEAVHPFQIITWEDDD